MKKLLTPIFLFFFLQGFAQQTYHFETRINGGGSQVARKILTTASGYVLGGYCDSSGLGRMALLSFIDSAGIETSSFLFGGFGAETVYDMRRCSDGSYIFAGNTTSFSSAGLDSSNAFLLRVSSTGSILWAKIYGGTGHDVFHSVCQTSDGGFAACGYTESMGQGSRDIFVVRTDGLGNAIWSNSYGTPGNDVANCINVTASGIFILTGYTDNFAVGNQIIAMKIRNDGFVTLSGTYDFTASVTNLDRVGNYVIETSGGYIVTGTNGKGSINDAQAFALKTDTSGFPVWANAYTMNSGDGTAHEIVPDPNGGFAIAAVMGNYYPALIHINSNGARDWSYYYSDASFNFKGECFSVAVSGGLYAIAGHKEPTTDTAIFISVSDGSGNMPCNSNPAFITQDMSLTAVPSPQAFIAVAGGTSAAVSMIWTAPTYTVHTVCANTGIPENDQQPMFSVFPNPANENITIRCEAASTDEMKLEMIDATGRIVFSSLVTTEQTIIPAQNFEAGFYFIRLAGPKGSGVQKIVISE